MQSLEKLLNQYPYLNSLFLTVLLILFYSLVKLILTKRIAKDKELSAAEKVITKRKIRDYGRIVLLFGVFFLWFSQLQTVFISLFAIAAAIVVALKEIIMCFTGGLLIRINHYYKIGDRIEIDGIRGFVVDKRLTATKILEIGPERNSQQTTGNIISIPNSIVLSKSFTNESYFHDFSIKSFVFIPHSKTDVGESEKLLLKLASEICSEYLEKAKDSISRYCRKEGIAIPSVEPRVKLVLTDSGDVKLLLKIPVKNEKISDIEQYLIKGYLSIS